MEENQGNKIAEPTIIEEKIKIELTDISEKNETLKKQETGEKDLSPIENTDYIPKKKSESTEIKEKSVENIEENFIKKLILSYDTEENREICTYN